MMIIMPIQPRPPIVNASPLVLSNGWSLLLRGLACPVCGTSARCSDAEPLSGPAFRILCRTCGRDLLAYEARS